MRYWWRRRQIYSLRWNCFQTVCQLLKLRETTRIRSLMVNCARGCCSRGQGSRRSLRVRHGSCLNVVVGRSGTRSLRAGSAAATMLDYIGILSCRESSDRRLSDRHVVSLGRNHGHIVRMHCSVTRVRVTHTRDRNTRRLLILRSQMTA